MRPCGGEAVDSGLLSESSEHPERTPGVSCLSPEACLHTALLSWGLFSKRQMWPWVFSVNLDWSSTRLRWEGKATCPLAIGWFCPGEVGLETAPSA